MAPGIARFVEDIHLRKGIELRLGAEVAGLVGTGGIEAVALKDGTRIAADLVLVSVGILPNSELAAAAGARI
jgi:3-phenylpropionate/trans-cinnamate dioxygenase ferredoxin reductase subunit